MTDGLLLDGKFTELAEQVYAFQLLTPQFCGDLIAALEKRNMWITEMEMARYAPIHPEYPFNPPKIIPSTLRLRNNYLAEFFGVEVEDPEYLTNKAFALFDLPDFHRTIVDICRDHVTPALKKLWPVYEGLFFEQPYVIKYEASGKRGMRMHADHETIALIVYLNEEFEGGGTHFPRWNLNLGKRPTGSAIVYPGGISHIHAGTPITAGKRYILRAGFF